MWMDMGMRIQFEEDLQIACLNAQQRSPVMQEELSMQYTSQCLSSPDAGTMNAVVENSGNSGKQSWKQEAKNGKEAWASKNKTVWRESWEIKVPQRDVRTEMSIELN